MNIIGKVNSWNTETKKDCFGERNPSNIDHIYPKGKNVANGKINQQRLSVEANRIKSNKLKGEIGQWEFKILMKTTPKDKATGKQLIYGRMLIRHDSWGSKDWKEVEPIL